MHGAFEPRVYLRRQKLLMAASMSCSSRVSKGCAQAEGGAPTSRSAALLHHTTVTSSTPGCCISTPNSLPASISTPHARGATRAAPHPFQSPTRAAPARRPTRWHRGAPWPPLRATSNHLNPSAPTLDESARETGQPSRATRLRRLDGLCTDLVDFEKAGNVCDLDLTYTPCMARERGKK